MRNRNLRYNKAVYWPKWASSAIIEFISHLELKELTLSDHLKEKFDNTAFYSEHKSAIESYIRGLTALDHRGVFEFYFNSSKGIKKICHRWKLNGTSYDITLVIAAENKVVTAYLNKSNYVHAYLKRDKYFKE